MKARKQKKEGEKLLPTNSKETKKARGTSARGKTEMQKERKERLKYREKSKDKHVPSNREIGSLI